MFDIKPTIYHLLVKTQLPVNYVSTVAIILGRDNGGEQHYGYTSYQSANELTVCS